MLIGPDRKRAKKRDRPKKDKKRAKSAARAAAVATTPVTEVSSVAAAPASIANAGEASSPAGDVSAGLEREPIAGSAVATGNPGSVTTAAASATTADLTTLGAPEPEPIADPIAVLLAGIDRARDRVDGLLDLAQTLAGPPLASPPVGRGLGLQLVPDLSPEPAVDEEPAATTTATATEAPAPTVAAVAVSAPAATPPTASATLVARELLERGMDANGVRDRLRDGYGVPDPDAVLAALA